MGHTADIGDVRDLEPLLKDRPDLLICELSHVEPEPLCEVLKASPPGRVAFVHVAREHLEVPAAWNPGFGTPWGRCRLCSPVTATCFRSEGLGLLLGPAVFPGTALESGRGSLRDPVGLPEIPFDRVFHTSLFPGSEHLGSIAMFGTIRKHQRWLWALIIAAVIVSFVAFFSPNQRMGREAPSVVGTIDGRPLSDTEVREQLRLANLSGFLRFGVNYDSPRSGFSRKGPLPSAS